MDWLLATPQIHSAFSSLGSFEGDAYVVSPNALAVLEEIDYKLTYEDQTLRTFRRAIGFGKNVRGDLIPLLENAKDVKVLDAVIRILVNLTVPVECLFSVDVMYRTEVGRHTIFELNKLLYSSKEAFTDPKSTKSVVEFMKHILESDSKLSPRKCDQINNCLLLLRNVLHIPESNANFIMHNSINGNPSVSMQNTILWNLFIQSIDKLLLYLMTCPQRAYWGVTIVQLIALMYKDQHVSHLQKLLNMWFEASLTESSDDNESNTSPPKQGSGDSSPMLTSDPTSDSSDNGGGSKNESSEDRRQALREETEATLQEVSRKGQEYQISILCDNKMDNSDESTNHAAETSAAANLDGSNAYGNKGVRTSAAEEDQDEEADQVAKQEQQQLKVKNQQPADVVRHTTKTELMEGDDAANFMPPPSTTNVKVSLSQTSKGIQMEEGEEDVLADAPSKPQKVPHKGQLHLTKGKCVPQKRECPSSQSELSDCGYATQVENQEFISTSSNDDDGPQGKPQHQKPPCNSKPRNKQRTILTVIDKKELRRKKLVKRSKSSLINMKGLVQHTPTDEDISNILKEFTVDFLLKGYGYLVRDLHSQLLTNLKISIDTSHFFWLVTYFLKFAAQLELDMEHINSILTYDIISYLTYEGVSLCEQLELNARQEGSDLKPYLRRMHLVVTAIREFLQAMETYKKVIHLNEEDREHLRLLQMQISSMQDLYCLFVLLVRRFNPTLHTKQYLQDLVVTNHILLLGLDYATNTESNLKIKMIDHISQFATLEIMHFYGILLEDFNNNGEFVNDCIFTMMHHVGGDLGQINTLFQPIILKTYSRIWETDYELCDDWSDLIEYVIHKFINSPQKSPLTLPTASLTELTKEHNLENTVCTWSQEDKDTLYWYYVQSKKSNDVVGKIVTLFRNNGNKKKSRISIIQQLLQQDIITLVEYDDLMKFEDAEYQRTLLTTPTSSNAESGIEVSGAIGSKPADDIQILIDLINKEGKGKHLLWLQKLLLECCYIKLVLKSQDGDLNSKNLEHIMEPVAYHSIIKNKSIPVVQWNSEQANTMLYQPFVLLLHKLGFQLPADAGSIFARVPDFWAPEMMYGLARKLGPVDKLLLKFDASQLDLADLEKELKIDATKDQQGNEDATQHQHHQHHHQLPTIPEADGTSEKMLPASNETFAMPKAKHANSLIRFTPDPNSVVQMPNWLQIVMRSKCNGNISSTAGATTAPSVATASERYFTNICVSTGNQVTTTTAVGSSHLMTASVIPATASNAEEQEAEEVQCASVRALAPTQALYINPSATSLLSCTSSVNNVMESSPELNKTLLLTTTTAAAATNAGHIRGESSLSMPASLTTPSVLAAVTSATVGTSSPVTTTGEAAYDDMQQPLLQQQQKQQIQLQSSISVSDDDSAMRSLERKDSNSSGVYTRSGSINLESEYSAMVAAVFQVDATNSDSASVASDLTRMYVSDEDEKHEFRVADFV